MLLREILIILNYIGLNLKMNIGKVCDGYWYVFIFLILLESEILFKSYLLSIAAVKLPRKVSEIKPFYQRLLQAEATKGILGSSNK